MITLQSPIDGLRISYIKNLAGSLEFERNEHTIVVNLTDPANSSALYPAGSPALLKINDTSDYVLISIQALLTEKLFGAAQPFCVREKVCDNSLMKLADRLYKTIRDHGNDRPLLVQTLLTSLLIHLHSRYPSDRLNGANGKLTSTQLLTICDYIHSRLEENIFMEQLCSLVELSRFHLTRLFKGTMGISPHRYILLAKIDYAKSFMKKRKGAILDAAYKLSFADHSHFTKTFRRFTGVTPRTFLATSCQQP
jgi:AraC family transcriptional regulator